MSVRHGAAISAEGFFSAALGESDPEIADAMAKLEAAKKAKDASIRAAILRADPSLESLLDAIDKNKQAAQ